MRKGNPDASGATAAIYVSLLLPFPDSLIPHLSAPSAYQGSWLRVEWGYRLPVSNESASSGSGYRRDPPNRPVGQTRGQSGVSSAELCLEEPQAHRFCLHTLIHLSYAVTIDHELLPT